MIDQSGEGRARNEALALSGKRLAAAGSRAEQAYQVRYDAVGILNLL